MESSFSPTNEDPKNLANIFSKIFFIWMNKVCRKCVKQKLRYEDLYKLRDCFKSKITCDNLQKNWQLEIDKSRKSGKIPSLLRAISKTVFLEYALVGMVVFLMVIVRTCVPVVLSYFLENFTEVKKDVDIELYIAASCLVLLSLANTLLVQHADYQSLLIGMRVRIAVTNLIYRKLVKLSCRSQTEVGQIVNLLSNDVNRFDQIFTRMHVVWILPLHLLLCAYLIWRETGIVTVVLIVMIAIVIFIMPLLIFVSNYIMKFRVIVAELTDSRVKIFHEVISGIKIIKMYAWEKSFGNIVKLARKREVSFLKRLNIFKIILCCNINLLVERIITCLAVASYVHIHNGISAQKLFSLVTLFEILSYMSGGWFGMFLTFWAETLVSIERLRQVLLLEHKPLHMVGVKSCDGGHVVVKKVDAGWTESTINLRNMNLLVPSGSLCVIIGNVGAGKTSLLQLLLGELCISNGVVKVSSNVSYASQNPWIFSSTVRNNITFGSEFNQVIYDKVLSACALDTDIKKIPHKDLAMVGERGITLSGGQRARINLARAVYKNSDIYLLDDPLSAVDTVVGNHIFEKCILDFLRDKTRILVTHQLHYLQKADLIVVLKDGQIETKGTFQELLEKNFDFGSFLSANKETTKSKDITNFVGPDSNKIQLYNVQNVKGAADDEDMDSTNAHPFKDYIKACGNKCSVFVVCVIYLVSQAFISTMDYWMYLCTLLKFTEEYDQKLEFVPLENDSNTTFYSYGVEVPKKFLEDKNTWLAIYSVLCFGNLFFILVRSVYLSQLCMDSSLNLHNKALTNVLTTTKRFFDVNPSGRILNRFSKDMGVIDDIMPCSLELAIGVFTGSFGNLLLIILVGSYYMSVPLLVAIVAYAKLTQWFLGLMKKLRHIESVAHSPVFSYINWTINGLVTIRAFRKEELLVTEFESHQDLHSAAFMLTLHTKSCFSMWLKLIWVIFQFSITLISLLLRFYDQMHSSQVGLSLAQTMVLLNLSHFGTLYLCEAISVLTNIERILQYTKLENENSLEGEKLNFLRLDWPNSGAIEFRNVSLKYSKDQPNILRNVNFIINPGEKIGIVGRTGAGKSSLISALFRLYTFSGSVIIDGVNTKNLELGVLRSRISIIPQESVLFSGSVRYNLDPFGELEDQKIWKALEDVELQQSVLDLDDQVSEDGGNFSVGQRQLFCLARAILRDSKILVLDEATANVDFKTNSLVQKTIRNKFKHCTVLCIAHRLDTVMDSDRILVMDSGKLVEFDEPSKLLQNSKRYFYKMVQETGPDMKRKILEIAQKK